MKITNYGWSTSQAGSGLGPAPGGQLWQVRGGSPGLLGKATPVNQPPPCLIVAGGTPLSQATYAPPTPALGNESLAS